MSGRRRRRLVTALGTLGVAFGVLLAAVGAERFAVGPGKDLAEEGALPKAAAMAQAALGGTVGETLAPFAAFGDFDAPLPSWLKELLAAVGPVEAVLMSGDGAIVSFTRPNCAADDGCVERALAMCGWRGVPAGIDGCASYVREEGEGQWLAVSQWQMGQDVVVLAQCA